MKPFVARDCGRLVEFRAFPRRFRCRRDVAANAPQWLQ